MLTMFAIRDRSARAFITPFFLPTRQMAEREFGYASLDKTHAFGRHPDDYSLYELGEFDPDSGVVMVHAEPKFIRSASSFAETIAEVRSNAA